MNQIEEKTTHVLGLAFKDESGNPIIPNSASYMVEDVVSGTSIKAETSFSPAGSDHDLEISWSDNALLDESHGSEVRRVLISFLYGAGDKKGNQTYYYKILNSHKGLN